MQPGPLAAHAERTRSLQPRDGKGAAIDMRILAQILERLREMLGPEQVWLFGSRARGDATHDSDWDLFVVMPDDASEDAYNPGRTWPLRRGAGVRADLAFCRASEFADARSIVNTLAHDVEREGVLIYER